MQTNFIKNLLNLEDVIVKNIKNLKKGRNLHRIACKSTFMSLLWC